MAKITAKANASDGTEYTVNLSLKTVTLNVAGNLSAGSLNGITGKALFGSFQDLWKSGATHNRYRFPFAMADGPTATMLELRGGWTFASDDLALLRDCGVRYTSDFEGATVTKEWACFVQGGSVADAADQPYYLIGTDTVPTNFGVANEFNECIKVYDSGAALDKRDGAKLFVREAGDTYGSYDLLTEQELSALTYRKYLIPMTTRADVGVSDAAPSGSPYSGMTLTIGATTNTINSTSYNFAEGEIDANGGTVQQIYDWFKYITRRGNSSDIDAGAGTQRGDTYTGGSLTFAGGILTTSQGLTIKNEAPADASNIIHTDDTGTGRQEAVTAAISVTGMPTDGADINLQIANETAKSASAWQATTAYTVGTKVLRTTGAGTESTLGLYMVCTTAGTSGGTEPTWDTTVGNTTADGSVTWTTYAILYYDDDPGSASYSSNYTDGEEFSAGDSVSVAFAELNGSTSFKYDKQTAIAASSGFTVAISTTTEAVYASNAVDGSTLTGVFSADIANDEIDLIADTDFTAAQAFAFYCYTLTTSAGMANFWGGVTAVDDANYRINTSILNLYFDETVGAFVKQTDSARIFRDDGARPAKDPTTGGYGLEINWKNPVYTVATGSALTSEQNAKLMGLPSASAVVDEWETQAAADPTGFKVNVAEMNGAAVQGDGSELDPWRGVGVDP